MYKIEFSNKANEDITAIYEYIAFELNSPQSAENQIKRIKETVFSLDIFPMRNPLYESELFKEKGMRYVTVDNYIIFYIPDEEKKIVSISRILYGKRNIEEIIR